MSDARPILWLDAQLPPAIAPRVEQAFRVRCHHVESLGLLESDDGSIFEAARRAGACLLTRDADFVILANDRGRPPAVIVISGPNLDADDLWTLLLNRLRGALDAIERGEGLIEIAAPRR